jgi:hypothetical protein
MRNELLLVVLISAGTVFAHPASSANLPSGSYLGSCNTCSFDGVNLYCANCPTGEHNFVSNTNTQASSINISQCPSGRAANIYGNLTCE